MKNRITAGLVVGFTAVGITAAMGDLSGQSAAAAESWRLAEVNGAALPFLEETDEDCRETITAGTLTLNDDQTWTLDLNEEEACADGTVTETERETGQYTADGSNLRFLDEDGEALEAEEEQGSVDLDDLGLGTRDADGLMVRLADGATTLRFVR